MGPVAAKIVKELRKAKRAAVIDLAAVRDARELSHAMDVAMPGSDDLPPNHAAWMRSFAVMTAFAGGLLETHALRKLADRVAAADEEYMPGGPPQSPVLDSVFASWWMADLPVGPTRESMCSIIADLGPVMGWPAELSRCSRHFAQSRLGVYRASKIGTDRVQLDELETGARTHVHVPSDMHTPDGDGSELWLTRLLPPLTRHSSDWVVWSTPYKLDGDDAEAEWISFCERVMASGAAAKTEPGDRLARHFKAVEQPQRWLEYIMDGYAGVDSHGSIALLGVPDRPATLPHHADYDARAAAAAERKTPLERLRLRVGAAARERDPAAFERALVPPDGARLPEVHRLMALAYLQYGRLDGEGRSALESIAREAQTLPKDEQRELEALDAGWFSAFEILHVRVDQGLEVRDVFGGRKLWITERSATRQVMLGDLLAGWVMIYDDGNRLEGAVCHVPERLKDAFVSRLRKQRKALERKHPELSPRKLNGLLPQRAAAVLEEVFAEDPLPELVNHDGESLLLATARYDIEDEARLQGVLARNFEAVEDGVYHLVAGRLVLATLRREGRSLRIECNSKERLERTKELLGAMAGPAIRHRADAFEDPRTTIAGEIGRKPKAKASAPPPLPPEAQAAVQAALLGHMRKWLDDPIPMLDGKTPREAARSERGRDTLTHMLVRQQEVFAAGQGLPVVDLSEIWKELGLQPRA